MVYVNPNLPSDGYHYYQEKGDNSKSVLCTALMCTVGLKGGLVLEMNQILISCMIVHVASLFNF